MFPKLINTRLLGRGQLLWILGIVSNVSYPSLSDFLHAVKATESTKTVMTDLWLNDT